MFFIRMIIRNLMRHRLRSTLTVIGVAIAVLAYGLLTTLVGLWYVGVEHSSATRLVTRNAISLVFPLPIAYRDRIKQVSGVSQVSWGNWFGGIYIDEKNFFASYAVDPRTYLSLYPELLIPPAQRQAFIHDRRGAAVGKKLAERFGWQPGDQVTLRGTIFPGQWTFTLRALYVGATKSTDERGFFFHWDYLNETMKKTVPRRADQVGFYMIGIADPGRAAEVGSAVDALFKNSLAETLTETERAFHLGFVSMTEAIMVAIQIVSYVVIVIIMAVSANTMAMTARERLPEYATMKALGFGVLQIGGLIFGESLTIALAGGVLGCLATYPAAHLIETELAQFFPAFGVAPETLLLDLAAALLVGTVAGIFPTWRGATIGVAEGLRRIG